MASELFLLNQRRLTTQTGLSRTARNLERPGDPGNLRILQRPKFTFPFAFFDGM